MLFCRHKYLALLSAAASFLIVSTSNNTFAAESNQYVKISEAVFSDIENLTCKAIDGGEIPTAPAMNTDTPGKTLNLYGFVQNPTESPVEIRFQGGIITNDEAVTGVVSLPLAGFDRPVNDDVVVLAAGEVRRLNLSMPTSARHSSGFGLDTIDFVVPNSGLRIKISSEAKIIMLDTVIFDGSNRVESRSEFKGVQFSLESFDRTTWLADGVPIEPNSPICP